MTCSLFVKFWANFLNQKASVMQGSISTCVLVSIVSVGRPSVLRPGLDMSSMVDETFQADDDIARQFHNWRVASEVSSKTPTSTFSACLPFLVVTAAFDQHAHLACRYDEGLHVFLPPILFTHTSTFASNTSWPPSRKLFSVIKPGSCLPS